MAELQKIRFGKRETRCPHCSQCPLHLAYWGAALFSTWFCEYLVYAIDCSIKKRGGWLYTFYRTQCIYSSTLVESFLFVVKTWKNSRRELNFIWDEWWFICFHKCHQHGMNRTVIVSSILFFTLSNSKPLVPGAGIWCTLHVHTCIGGPSITFFFRERHTSIFWRRIVISEKPQGIKKSFKTREYVCILSCVNL